LWDESAARNAKAWERAYVAYVALATVSVVAVTASLGVDAAYKDTALTAAGTASALVVATLLMAGVAWKLTGGRIRPWTPAGTTLLAEAKRRPQVPPGTRCCGTWRCTVSPNRTVPPNWRCSGGLPRPN
jgi:hypothetical protein